MDDIVPQQSLKSDAAVLACFASVLLLVHFYLGNGYGFHRDELQFLDDARHLAWGYVAYPPLTSLCGRLAIALFGISPGVFRLPAALANMVSLVLAGLMARELGGRRPAQVLALLAALPVGILLSSVLQYNSFDMLAWSLVFFFTARVLRTGDGRNWVGVGAGIGIGVLSKYSIAFPVAGLVAGLMLLPSARHWWRSRWLWLGVAVAAVIAAPNLIWLASHHWITLQMEHHIHIRDVRIGRAKGYWTDQLKFTLLMAPLAVAGLLSLMRSRRFRLLSALYLGPLILLALAKGRGYYLLPGYSLLYAAGAVALERVVGERPRWTRIAARTAVVTAVFVNAAAVAWVSLPMWPVGSAAWNWQMKNNSDMANEVGWPQFVAEVAAVRDTLPAADRTRLAVLANNFGEAGALALYGPQYGLPEPISTTNSFFYRGYGPYEPETLIVVGSNLEDESRYFEHCVVAAQVTLPYGVQNEETIYYPQILVCHKLKGSWKTVWATAQDFG